MRYRYLLAGSIIAVALGIILWNVFGPVIALSGIASHYEGQEPYGHSITEFTALWWIGVSITRIGIVSFFGGKLGAISWLILVLLARRQQLNTGIPKKSSMS